MEGADDGDFAQDPHCTSTVYRPRITELSARGHSGTEVKLCISGMGTCITHVKLEHEATSSKRGGNDNYGVASIFHPDRQMQVKIPPLAKNEVIYTAKRARIGNLQPAKSGCGVCMCIRWSHFA
jgi:hypothetical protein